MLIRGVEFPEAEIVAFCRNAGIARLSLFGSILTDDFSSDSDIDMLVEFRPGQAVGLMAFAGMQEALSAILTRRVHLHTLNMLPPSARAAIRGVAKVQYAA